MLIFIPNNSINELMVQSMREAARVAKTAKRVDIIVTVDGQPYCSQGDWIKYMVVGQPEPETLRKQNKSAIGIGALGSQFGSELGSGIATFNKIEVKKPNCKRCNFKIILENGRCDVCGL